MRKSNTIFFSLFIIIIVAIIIYYFIQLPKLYNDSLGHQRKTLQQMALRCSEQIQSDLHEFQSDLNYVLFSDNLRNVFKDSLDQNETLKKLQFFYSKHGDLIKNINIYDNNKRGINIYKGEKNNFITDAYPSHRQKRLVDSIRVRVYKDKYYYYIPAFDGNELVGNIEVTIDLKHFSLAVLKKYYLKENIWQWIIDLETNEIATDIQGSPKVEIEGLNTISNNLKKDYGDYLVHSAKIEGKNYKLITYYTPLTFRDKKFGIAFSQNFNFIVSSLYNKLILTIVPPFAVLIILVLILFFISYQREKYLKKDTDLTRLFNEFMEYIPIGLAIVDANNKVLIINQVAREILMIKDKSDISDTSISGKFLFSKKYARESLSKSTAYDTDQFVLYQKEGNEVVLFKKEISCFIRNKEYNISAFIDVTSIEKSRKYEEAANTAKSEFLAKMSHEIRTPMNGIIGMTEALLHNKLTKEQKEHVEVIKSSADLLLNIVDDILDYSKIEAGKMQLEEIPFKLREEIRIALDLFRPIIDEKGIKLTSLIEKQVPENLIGDPFRLRQVLSNLISNAVKFTHEGEIRITVEVEEEYSGNLTLRISVIDTGVGIPKNRLDTIFNSFTQADYSTSRKYGGSGLGTTISKQLVNLMNGEIWVESPSGISKNKKYPGSKFVFTFEVYSNEKLDKNIDFSGIKNFSDINALIITQNQSTKKRLFGFLEHYGIHIDVAHIKEEIIDEIKNQFHSAEKTYHVVFIMDEPNFDGLWIGKELQKAGITDKSIFFMISSSHKQENYVQTKVVGIDYYLTQPFEQNLLKNYLSDCIPGIQFEDDKPSEKIRQNLNILVAEDNLLNQKVAVTIFDHLGFKIDIANNGREVIEMIQKKPYDIVFMDLMMPDKDGIDATVEIRGLGFQIPIIAMTATASKTGKTNALNSGMNDYITKPVNMAMVKNVLLKWFS